MREKVGYRDALHPETSLPSCPCCRPSPLSICLGPPCFISCMYVYLIHCCPSMAPIHIFVTCVCYCLFRDQDLGGQDETAVCPAAGPANNITLLCVHLLWVVKNWKPGLPDTGSSSMINQTRVNFKLPTKKSSRPDLEFRICILCRKNCKSGNQND